MMCVSIAKGRWALGPLLAAAIVLMGCGGNDSQVELADATFASNGGGGVDATGAGGSGTDGLPAVGGDAGQAPHDGGAVSSDAGVPDAVDTGVVDAVTDPTADAAPTSMDAAMARTLPSADVPPTVTLQATPVCTPSGWCWESPYPHGLDVSDVYVASPTVAYATARGGGVLRWQQGRWDMVDVGTHEDLFGVSGSGPDDVWVVGTRGTAIHYDGRTWRATTGLGVSHLTSVWVAGDGTAWTVGLSGKIFHWDGQSWAPAVSPTDKWLDAVWGATPNDVWAVGFEGTILHFDGRGWKKVLVDGLRVNLRDVSGASATAVWALGDDQTVLRWDGDRWRRDATGVLGNEDPAGLVAFPPDDAWIIGTRGALARWDGEVWLRSAITLPAGASIAAIDGAGPNALWAAGARGTVLRFDGAKWHLGVRGQDMDQLSAIHGDGKGTTWAAGTKGPWRRRARGEWESMKPGEYLGAVFVFGENSVWVSSGTTSHHWNGQTWTRRGLALSAVGPYKLWGADASALWFAGWEVRFWDGNTISEISAPAPARGIWGFARNDVWLAGDNRVSHFDGNEWTGTMSSVVGVSKPTDLAGAKSGDVWVVGPEGETAHLKDGQWIAHPVTNDPNLLAVWSDAEATFAAGEDGHLLRWTGTFWRRELTGLDVDLVDLWGSPGQGTYVVGRNGSVLRRSPGSD